MLNPFPELLYLGFFIPTLLRVTVAVVLFLIALRFIRDRAKLAHTRVPVVGSAGIALIYFAIAVEACVGVMLLFGWGTQIAALLGTVILLKHAVLTKYIPAFSPRSPSVYVLTAIICLTLVVSGAGAFAMDLLL